MDDEPIARKVLREELEQFSALEVVGEAENGEDALRLIYTLDPDLVFLDLQMPSMGGFEVVRNLRSESAPFIVILTAYDQHAIEAFEAGAIDYLLKPVSEPRLRKAIERAVSLQGKKQELAGKAAKLAAAAGPAAYPTSRKIVGKSGKSTFCSILRRSWRFRRRARRCGSSPPKTAMKPRSRCEKLKPG